MDNLKKTPLYKTHIKYGGKIIDFAGWALPVQYEGIIKEHLAVRTKAGLFDISHMGEIKITGPDAEKFIQYLVTNDISKLAYNQVIYTTMCYQNGGTVDDLLVYKFSSDDFLLVVNASNTDKDYNWILDNKERYNIKIKNISNNISQLALQGPKAQEILQSLTEYNFNKIKFFCFEKIDIKGIKCIVSRTGYTGEDGFEIYTKNEYGPFIWEQIMEKGKELGLKPVGLGARDTLRFEAGLPLYGNELSNDISPLEAGLGFFVKLDKDFIGKDALQNQKQDGIKRKLIGFEMIDNGIPRHGYKVAINGNVIGFVTTGYFSPTLKKNIGLALIGSRFVKVSNKIEILIRKKPLKAVITGKNFYKNKYKK
jgi:aminomethyltransferase